MPESFSENANAVLTSLVWIPGQAGDGDEHDDPV